MLKRTLFVASVLAMPIVAEAQRGRPGPGFRHGPGAVNQREVNIASRIGQKANSLAIDARMVADRAQAGGHAIRAKRFNELRVAARQLAAEYNRSVVPTLQSRAPEHLKKRTVQSTRPLFLALDKEFSGILAMPLDLQGLYRDIKEDQELLRRVMFGGAVRPPVGVWHGTCEVVLETLWGTNIKSFFGYAAARTQALAAQQAKISGLQQCNANLGGWTKCTVASNCGAQRG